MIDPKCDACGCDQDRGDGLCEQCGAHVDTLRYERREVDIETLEPYEPPPTLRKEVR